MNYSLPGASELAILLGLQRGTDDGEPYTSEYTLWARLVGLLPRYDTEAKSPDAELGILFEPAIGLDWCKRHHAVTVFPGPQLHQDPLRKDGIPFTARPDFFVWLSADQVGPDTLEVKCPRSLHPDEWGADGSSDVPPYYAVQVLAQMVLADAKQGFLAAVARAPGWGSNRLRGDFVFQRDLDREKALIAHVHRWVEKHLEGGVPPMVDGSASTNTTLRWAGRALGRVEKTATAGDLEYVHRALQTATAVQEIMGRQREARNRLMAAMGDATELLDENGETIATFRPNKNGVRSLRIRNERGGEE